MSDAISEGEREDEERILSRIIPAPPSPPIRGSENYKEDVDTFLSYLETIGNDICI